MENIWYIFATVLVSAIILLIIGIVIFIKKEKYYIFSEIVIIALVLFCLISDMPYIKDIAKQETVEVIAVYVEYQRGNVHPGARRLVLKSEEGTLDLLAPIITKDHVKMSTGKSYKIEYYINSKVIKDYTLIE